jgi:hypothetical protein
MQNALSLRSVVIISRTHTQFRVVGNWFLRAKSDAELAKVVRASARSLAVISRGGLAPDVRISREKVTSMLWTLFKAAKAEQFGRKFEQWQEERDARRYQQARAEFRVELQRDLWEAVV